MTDITQTDYKTLIQTTESEARKAALQWAEKQTDGELLNMLVEQRNIVDQIDLERNLEAAQHKAWDKALTDELTRRMAEQNVKSMNINNVGMATLVTSENYNVNDPDALYKHVVEMGSIALFGTAVKKSEVRAYQKEHGVLPDGIAVHQAHSIRITRG